MRPAGLLVLLASLTAFASKSLDKSPYFSAVGPEASGSSTCT
jgi:hypothetical protein